MCGTRSFAHWLTLSDGDGDAAGEPCSLCKHMENNLCLLYTLPLSDSSDMESPSFKQVFHEDSRDVEYPSFKQLFHEDCSKCLDIPVDSLCQMCQHTRLGHLVRCVLHEGYNAERGRLDEPYVNVHGLQDITYTMGTVHDLQSLSACETCRTFASQASSIANRHKSPPNTLVRLNVSMMHGEIGGVESEFKVELFLKDPGFKRSQQATEFFGTVDVSSGANLVSLQRPDPLVNLDAVSSWLQECDRDTGHDSPCYLEVIGPPVHGFRVIDTQKRCVVLAPERCRYATLSYVWGEKHGTLQATMENVTPLGKEGSLTSEKGLPATIDDAINVCRDLEIPFLWVDRLCIVQDQEPSKKAIQLNAMGGIYSHSYVTLVALAGDHAENGLPGTNGRERSPQWTGQTQGIYLFEENDDFSTVIQHSKWHTRGWAFQEAMLSRRILAFSNRGAFYQCQTKETYIDEDNNENGAFGDGIQISLSSYPDLVAEYTARDLTYKSDILNAFSGIMHTVYESRHHYGFPFDSFHQTLLWKTNDGKSPQFRSTAGIFPSWSWSSVDNSIILNNGLGTIWTRISAPLAQVAIPVLENGQTVLKVVPHFTDCYSKGSHDQDIGYDDNGLLARLAVLIAWKEGCFPGKLPEAFNAESTWEQYKMMIWKRWKSLACISDEAFCTPGGLLSPSDEEMRFPLRLQQACQEGCILVYTQSQRLRIIESEGHVRLQNEDGDMIGWLVENSINWERLRQIPNWNDGARFDVLALSMPHEVGQLTGSPDSDPASRFAFPEFHPAKVYLKETANWRDSEGKTIFLGRFQDYYYVRLARVSLMVVETNNGISTRLALAEAPLKIWTKAARQFDTFILG